MNIKGLVGSIGGVFLAVWSWIKETWTWTRKTSSAVWTWVVTKVSALWAWVRSTASACRTWAKHNASFVWNWVVRKVSKKGDSLPRRKTPRATKVLWRSVFMLALALTAGAVINFVISKVMIESEISFSGKFGAVVLRGGVKTLILDVDPEDPDTFADLDIVLKDIIQDPAIQERIEFGLIVDAHSKILAASLKGSGSAKAAVVAAQANLDELEKKGAKGERITKEEFLAAKKLLTEAEAMAAEISQKEEKLVGTPYPDYELLKGLEQGFGEIKEDADAVTLASTVLFGAGEDENVQGYVILALNRSASDKAGNWLILGILFVFVSGAYVLYTIFDVIRVLIQFTNVPAAERVLAGELKKPPEKITVVVGEIDVVASTDKAVNHTAEELIDMLNNLMSLMGWVLADYNLVIDKIIGDSILWRIVVPKGDKQAKKAAARAAIEASACIQYIIRAANYAIVNYHVDDNGVPNGVPLLVRIGISSGVCVQGFMGPPGVRQDFTMIGLVVNLAVRVEAACREAGVLITGYLWGDSNEVVDGVAKDEFLKGTMSLITDAKGFENKPVTVYQVDSFTPEVAKRLVRYIIRFFRREDVRAVLKLDNGQRAGHLKRMGRYVMGLLRRKGMKAVPTLKDEQYASFVDEKLRDYLSECVRRGMPLPAPEM